MSGRNVKACRRDRARQRQARNAKRRPIKAARTAPAYPRTHKGRFDLGNPGRPKGSRNKIAEAFIQDLYADWLANGAKAIARVREKAPAAYLRVTASILPKQFEVNTDAFDGKIGRAHV